MIELNKRKIEEIIPLFEEKISRRENVTLAPWQKNETVAGVSLFPEKNNAEAIEFLFLLGALNFSYWQKDKDKIYTWGVATPEVEKLVDVFALAYALADSQEKGWLKYSADFYQNISKRELNKIFSDRVKNSCEIPMLSHRCLKVREIGRGLKKFSEETNEPPTAGSFLQFFNSIPGVLGALEDYFPYSFGDPFRKLSQLMVKMLIDRRDENMPAENLFTSDKFYREATEFNGVDELKAQPDYMLPLFCIRTGLWELDNSLGNLIAQKVEIPMDHPYEREIRRKTVKTVKKIAGDLEGNPGLNNCRVDSLMWQTAVEGCFAGGCESCKFGEKCGAYLEDNERLNWPHHLTRTPNY